jgi:hypothetical protein
MIVGFSFNLSSIPLCDKGSKIQVRLMLCENCVKRGKWQFKIYNSTSKILIPTSALRFSPLLNSVFWLLASIVSFCIIYFPALPRFPSPITSIRCSFCFFATDAHGHTQTVYQQPAPGKANKKFPCLYLAGRPMVNDISCRCESVCVCG